MSRRERHRRRRRSRGNRRHGTVGVTLVVMLTILGLVALGVMGYVYNVVASVPPLDELKPVPKGTSSVIYAADGSQLGYIQSDAYRTPIAWKKMPKRLRQATVAIEDERFYSHKGVDYQSIARAAVKNLKSGKTVQGGSTLTQQLVRNTYISPARTLERKIVEAKLAQELERRLSKDEIMHRYLNSVSYGTIGGVTAIGVQAAAQMYYSKDAEDLDLEEAALLAGLPQAPSVYNPFKNPKAALERRNEVIQTMERLGYISTDRAERAYSAPLGIKKGSEYTDIKEPFFFDYVKEELIGLYGVNTVRKGGLRVYTTIDPKLQEAGRSAIDTTLNMPGDPSSAVLAIDPRNGYIRAMASSSKYRHSQFNLAGQGHRQPGSSFKTFALTTAIRRGIDPESTTYESKPLNIPIPGYGFWKVETYGKTYGGKMNLVQATLASDNTVYAQLALDLGPDSVADTAHDMGIVTKLDSVPSETLGGLTLGVSPLEMASAYGTLAAGGVRTKPIAIRKVVFPGGKVERLGEPKRKQVFSDGVAAEVTKILEQNILKGTGTGANMGCPAAGKTGTTDNFNDAWFVGYTPRLAAAVWVGYPNALREMRSVHGISVAGGTFPAEIWQKFMSVAKGDFCGSFPPPKTSVTFTPFYGKYGVQGKSSGESQDSGDSSKTSTNEGGTNKIDRRKYAPDPTGQLDKEKPSGRDNGSSDSKDTGGSPGTGGTEGR